MHIGFIGLGAMGEPIAANLARVHQTSVYNRSFAKAEAHAQQYGSQAVSLAQIAETEAILTCLPTSREVGEMVTELVPHLTPGQLWIDLTSGEPEKSRELANRLAAMGVLFCDAPVSGGTAGARAGTLTIMVGGDPEAFPRVQDLLSPGAARVVHVGPVGAGDAVKAVNNALLAANLWATGEGLAALTAFGIDPAAALEVINHSSGRSNASENLIPERVLSREFPLTFRLELLVKDLTIALSVLDNQVPAPLLRLTREVYFLALRELGSGRDHVEALKVLEHWAGVEIA